MLSFPLQPSRRFWAFWEVVPCSSCGLLPSLLTTLSANSFAICLSAGQEMTSYHGRVSKRSTTLWPTGHVSPPRKQGFHFQVLHPGKGLSGPTKKEPTKSGHQAILFSPSSLSISALQYCSTRFSQLFFVPIGKLRLNNLVKRLAFSHDDVENTDSNSWR